MRLQSLLAGKQHVPAAGPAGRLESGNELHMMHTGDAVTRASESCRELSNQAGEIGGNDLLAGVEPECSSSVSSPPGQSHRTSRTVVMFELPLFPHKITYGQVQRRLAKKVSRMLNSQTIFHQRDSVANCHSGWLHLFQYGTHRWRRCCTVLSPVWKSPIASHAQ